MSGFGFTPRVVAFALALVAVCMFATVAVACPPVQVQSFGVHAQAVCPQVAVQNVQSFAYQPQAVQVQQVQSYAVQPQFVQAQAYAMPFAVQAFAVHGHAVNVQAVKVQAARPLLIPRRSVTVQKTVTRVR